MTATHALTVRQPWTNLIVLGNKDVENRTWRPPDRIIGRPLAIHASKQYRADEHHRALLTARHLNDNGETDGWVRGWRANRDAPRGALIGTVIVTGAHQCDATCSPWAQKATRVWHWELAGADMLPQPLVMPGRLGIWPIPTGP